MTAPIDILPDHLVIVQNILRKYLPAYSKVWVFGSRAKGTARKFSDLDLVIDSGKPLSSTVMTNITFDLEESDLPYKVDVVDWAVIDRSFQKRIHAERIIIDV